MLFRSCYPKESIVQLEYQDLLIKHLRLNRQLKKIYPEILHNKILFYQDTKQRRCAVRILTYIDGDMYAKSKNTDHTEKALGRLLALQSNQLQSFIKNQAIRKFEWDPSNIRWTKKFINLFKGVNKNIIKKTIDEHEKFVFKNIKNLKHAVTHGDPNEDGTFYFKKHKIYLYKEDFENFSNILGEMTKYIIDEKGLEVISEIHDKDFKSKKEEESSNDDSKEDEVKEDKKDDEKSDEVEFEDI